MSASTVIANVTADFEGFSTEAKSVIVTLLSRVTAIENTLASATTGTGPLATALTDATNIVEGALSVGAAAAEAATNPIAAAVALGNAAAPVSQLFVNGYNLVKGVIEGLEGKPAPAGASQSEVDGDAAGAEVKNFFDAIVDTLVDPLMGKTPPAAS